MSDGSITFSTALDNEQLEKDIKQAEKDIKSLENKISNGEQTKSDIERQMESAEQSIRETEAAIDSLRKKLEELNQPTKTPKEFMDRQPLVDQTQVRLDEEQASLNKQVSSIDKLNDKWQKTDQSVMNYSTQLESVKRRQQELAQEYSRTYSSQNAALQGAMAGAEKSFGKFTKRIGTMMKKVFFFGVILAGLRAIKSYLSDAATENEKLARSFEGAKATIAGFAAGIVNAALPAILGFVTMFTSMLTALARLIDMIFHTNIVASINASRKAANSIKKQTKATKDLAKAQKDANSQIMAFDEVNKMDDPSQSSRDTGSGSDGNGNATGIDIGKIDDSLAEIMAILGAAVLAVGAILCFSGINIPLGITLMAIGALMLYTVASENWSKLPQQVRDAITGALVLVGMSLLIIGAILAFSGVATPLGIGMMAAGALVLWAAVGLNWSSMDAQLQTVVSTLMGILGVALLVIGAVLAFSGAGTPLGIGLMIVGAASLAAAVALNWDALRANIDQVVTVLFAVLSVAMLVLGAVLLFSGAATPLGLGLLVLGAAALAHQIEVNWDSMPTEMQQVISTILEIVGIAFLVLGAVLTFSGANLPLGIALLVIGAGALVSEIALNWEKMSQETRDFISTMLTIVGAALIVIGVILICTGVGIPLGIACILAGIGSFVVAAALNWDFILDKIKEMWRSVCSWWDSTVAPIFTFGWWRDKFKSIVNGLISCINSGLNAFGGFINGIANGVSGILGNFGISWSGHVNMPQIPYLAGGAVIPPNRKFMAVLGDQTNGNNLEAPEGLIRQIVREEAGVNGAEIASAVQQGIVTAFAYSGGIGSENDTNVTIVLKVGHEELARAVFKGADMLQHRGEIKGELSFV